MNKKQAKSIAEIVNASFMVVIDTPDSYGKNCSSANHQKIQSAQKEFGLKMLKKHGLEEPILAPEDVYDHVMNSSS